MENMFNKPYEISLWEDYLNFEVSFLNESNEVVLVKNYEDVLPDFTIENPEGYKTSIVQFYKERKICIIGSDTMNTPLRAFNGKFIINTNGSSTLSFSMQCKYYDVDAGILRDNPYVKLLVNERKVKLRYGLLGAKDTKWYDFVIKNVQENSETKTFNYTAKNLFINELSKSGFNLEFDTELENNQGTIVELGRRVLEGSDWQIPEDFEVILQQTKNEPLYKITLSEAINGINMENNSDIISIAAGKEIYGFYTSINEELPFFQFLYREDGIYELDEDYVITNSPNYYIDSVKFIEGQPSFSGGMVVSDEYRGLRLVRKASTTYDKVLDKYVAIYKDENGLEVRGYTEDEYISPVAVSNYVVNSKDFDSLTGWKEGGSGEKDNVIYPILELKTLPDIFETIYNVDQVFTSYLSINFSDINQVLFNSSVSNYRSQLNGFTEGSKFVFRIKYGIESGETIANTNLELGAKVCKYELVDGVYKILDTYFIFDNLTGNSTEYKCGDAICIKPMSYSEMTLSKLGLFIYPKDTWALNNNLLIEEVQLFPYIEDAKDQVVFPETIPTSGVKKHYLYYYPNSSDKDAEDVKYIYNDTKPATQFKTKYNDESNYQKVRTITARESNRFNLIQDLCELFECWPKFEIEHNELTGEILLDENYRQKKFVTFHEYIGKENDAGFKYGINLKAIQRTIDSEAIVSKIVVKSNQNEYAVDGSCNIARAPENPTGENFVYDFSYYINQRMLNFNTVNNDLFLETDGYIGYYKKLKRLNKKRDEWIIEQAELLTNQSDLEANLQIYTTSVDQSQELKRDKEIELRLLTGFEFSQFMNPPEETPEEDLDKISDWKKDNATKSICASIARLVNVIERHGALRDMAQVAVKANLARQEELKENLKKIKEEKLALEIQFYKKYSRFIQEGSWIDENYVDDNLYYLDAESTLHTSSQPKITYTINVLELSQIPGYENYSFNVGDKTYMEDIEFFGWKQVEGIQTPRKEEILVNEITIALDSPEQNQIKVQNYKTQFEDLFQRITATTQNVDYSTGKYNKATSIVETDGTIKVNTLQNSIANNSLIISNAKDQSVIWDETGITTTSLSSPNEVVRIVSGGIFLSTDGGVNWNTGISGKGINANYITTGQLDTSIVQILAGAFPSFRWDSAGLSAYEFELEEDGKTGKNFNYSKFIRFDQFGLYGIKGFANFNPLEETEGLSGEEKIWKYADFALTWKGFQLRNKYGDGYVSISSTDDFVVSDGENIRIKIGNLGTADAARYGIKIADAKGNSVMETADDGTLWLKNSLNIETYNKERVVAIGKLSDSGSINTEHGGQVINATENFIVYEDGHVVARSGSFNGRIEAIEGTIGGFTISNNKLSSENANARIILGKEIESCISLDGANQAIIAYKGGSLDNFSWRLSSDGAIFNNITARGSIKAATFEYGAVQAIGGILLVRPSSKIKKIVTDGQKDNVYILYPETEFTGFKKNDVCLIEKEQGIKEYFTILEVEDNLGKVISIKIQTNNKLDDSYIGAPIINLGSENSVGIGINGSTNDAFIPSNSISVLEFNGVNAFRNKIILGKLPEQKDRFGEAAGKYGLYAENVFLTGFLTAEAKKEGNTNYSGIGTTLSANGPSTVGKRDLFPNADQQLGQILIWAGAKGTSKEAIEKAPFFVDQYGNMYAGSAYFKGTVITESTIEAAEIKTAIITGTGNQSGYGLVIKDLQKGIIFQKDGENVFSLGVNGLETSLNASFSGELLAGELAIHGKKLSKKNATASVIFEDTEISLKTTNAIKFLEKSNSEAEDKIIGEYKQVEKNGKIVGYDLYIYEE